MRAVLLMLLGILLVWLLEGCASVESLSQTLTERQVRSCISFAGSYSVFVGVHGLIATGGATIPECLEVR